MGHGNCSHERVQPFQYHDAEIGVRVAFRIQARGKAGALRLGARAVQIRAQPDGDVDLIVVLGVQHLEDVFPVAVGAVELQFGVRVGREHFVQQFRVLLGHDLFPFAYTLHLRDEFMG